MKRLEGKRVRIWWLDPDCTWPFFTVLKVKQRMGMLLLQGEDSPDGTEKYEGKDFWCFVDEISVMQELERYVH